MGSISFRQGQKALACRLAHCVALTNDVAWKKPNQALLYLWCNIIVKPALIGSIFKLVMMKTRPWWWDQVGTPHLTHSAAPLPQNTRQQIRERPKTADWACSAIVLYLLSRFVRFWTEYMYQLVSFFSGTMHVKLSCCLVVWQTFWKLFINTEGAPIRPLTCDDHSIHPSIHPIHFLLSIDQKGTKWRTKTTSSELKWTEMN